VPALLQVKHEEPSAHVRHLELQFMQFKKESAYVVLGQASKHAPLYRYFSLIDEEVV
jgi:hypothetical protein